MHLPPRFPVAFSVPLASACLLLLAALVPAGVVSAQSAPQVQASYPLMTDLLDATNTYGPAVLYGAPPPAAPANGVCLNGIYYYSPGGQDIRTPVIASLNTNDFEMNVEFTLAGLPAFQGPVLMAGTGWRFLGIYVQANGTVGLKYNNSNFTWSNTVLSVGPWYLASVKYENGTVELHLNGHLIHQASIGVLNTSTNFNFCTNDYSNGGAFYGCIRNLVIANDTTLGRAASSTNFAFGCDGLAQTGVGIPTLGNLAFGVQANNVPAVSPLVFHVFGISMNNPGLDLTGLGMPGCFSYTGLELGTLGPSVVAGGSSTLPLPIPNLPAIAGTVLYTQAVSYSLANPLGFAASNGTQLVLGF